MIAVTQTGIMGVVSAPFSSNTKGALSTSPLIQPAAFLLFLLGDGYGHFSRVTTRTDRVTCQFYGVTAENGPVTATIGQVTNDEIFNMPQKGKKLGKTMHFARYSKGIITWQDTLFCRTK